MYLVTRPFQDDGIQRIQGEIVDGTGYRLLSKLIGLRYLKDVGVLTDEASFRCQLCDRAFIDQETLDRHYIENHPDEIEITDDPGTEGDSKEIDKEGVKTNEPNNKGKGKSGKADSNVS